MTFLGTCNFFSRRQYALFLLSKAKLNQGVNKKQASPGIRFFIGL